MNYALVYITTDRSDEHTLGGISYLSRDQHVRRKLLYMHCRQMHVRSLAFVAVSFFGKGALLHVIRRKSEHAVVLHGTMHNP